MSFNDSAFPLTDFNFAADSAWDYSVSNSTFPFVPPRGSMDYLDATDMIFLSGNRMSYLET
jgi:hypothetical protein